MLISELSQQKRDSNRFNLYIDGVFKAGISINTVSNFSLYKGREIEEVELDEVLKHDIEERFYIRTVNYLGRGIKSEKKIREYIRNLIYKKKGVWFGEEVVERLETLEDKTIERLRVDGYINDQNYAQLYVESRLRSKPRGESLLRNELFAKGISREIVDQVIGENSIDEEKLAKQVYRKKFGESKFLKTERKKSDFLMRRGFSWDVISKLIDHE